MQGAEQVALLISISEVSLGGCVWRRRGLGKGDPVLWSIYRWLYFLILPLLPTENTCQTQSNRGDYAQGIWRETLGYVGALYSGRWRLRASWGDLGHQAGWGHPAGQGFSEDMTFKNRNSNHSAMLSGQAKPWLQASRLYWRQTPSLMRGEVSSQCWWGISPPNNKSWRGIEEPSPSLITLLEQKQTNKALLWILFLEFWFSQSHYMSAEGFCFFIKQEPLLIQNPGL